MAKSKTIETCKVATYLPIADLKFYPKNPRTISRERLDDMKCSIIEKGFYEPILVWAKDNIVLAGNHRTKAVLELLQDGYTFKTPTGKTNELPVVIEDVSPQVAEEILFETNNHYADWIEDELQKALLNAQETGKDLAAYGFSTKEVDSIVKDAMRAVEKDLDRPPGDDVDVDGHTRAAPGDGEHDDEATEARARTGDVWRLGPHMLYCREVTDWTAVEQMLEGRPAVFFAATPVDSHHLERVIRAWESHSGEEAEKVEITTILKKKTKK